MTLNASLTEPTSPGASTPLAMPISPAAAAAARLIGLLARHAEQHGFELLDAASVPAFAAGPGDRLLLLTEEPVRSPESWDLAVLLPELARLLPKTPGVGMLPAPDSRSASLTWGVRTWPALVLLRDGALVGTVEGLRDWADYAQDLPALAARAPSPARPGVIPIATAPRSGCGS